MICAYLVRHFLCQSGTTFKIPTKKEMLKFCGNVGGNILGSGNSSNSGSTTSDHNQIYSNAGIQLFVRIYYPDTILNLIQLLWQETIPHIAWFYFSYTLWWWWKFWRVMYLFWHVYLGHLEVPMGVPIRCVNSLVPASSLFWLGRSHDYKWVSVWIMEPAH